jgi:hypothetical protein
MSEPSASHGSRDRIARQIILPWSKSLEITIKNLRVRFFRSLITVSSLVLAVSFLAFVLVNTDIARGILTAGGDDAVRLLTRAGFEIDPSSGTIVTGAKERWIVILSLVVCTVGIVNAQLMSVTERFREIGIMKCLGALDRIVLRLFLMEAGIQGGAGALAGAVLGLLFSLLQNLFRFGLIALTSLPVADVLLSLTLAVFTGCVLSVLGVLYPAALAARMKPVDVMKSEY